MTARALLTAATCLLAFAAPRSADAQAMISYGTGVAKAGVAGAAAGAGTVGVIGKLRGTLRSELEQAAAHGTQAEQGAAAKFEKALAEQPEGVDSLKTSSGVVVSGLDTKQPTNKLITSKPDAGEVAIHKVQWAESAQPDLAYLEAQRADETRQVTSRFFDREEQSPRARRSSAPQRAGNSGGSTSGGSGGSSSSAGPAPQPAAKAPAAESAPPPASRSAGRGQSQTSRGPALVVGGAAKPVTEAPAERLATVEPVRGQTVSQATEAGVEIGWTMEEVIRALGDPIVIFHGLSGHGYTAKYVFTDADGRRITIYAWHGRVTSVLVA